MRNSGVDALWIARYDYRSGWRLKLHDHSYYQMIFFLDGKGVFTVEEEPYPIAGGELFLLCPGEKHGLRAESLVRTLDVKFKVAPGRLARQLRRAARMQQSSEPGLAARFERIRMEGERKHAWYREVCGLLLEEILYLYLRQDLAGTATGDAGATPELAAHDPLLQRALAFIQGNFQRPLTVREVALAAGCTDRTLRLHFHNVLETRPLAFLQRARIERAKVLIQYSDYTLKEIAEAVGFQTVHHFTRLFTGMEERSPAAWRQRYLEGIRKDVYIHPRFENRIFTLEEEEAKPGESRAKKTRGESAP
jgi:AraC-like DNA-binding protein